MIDFSGAWSRFWGAISGSLGGLADLLAVVGMLMLVGAFFGWLMQKRKGGGFSQGASGLVVTMLVGGILAGPNILIPIFLNLFDFAVNAAVSLIGTFS